MPVFTDIIRQLVIENKELKKKIKLLEEKIKLLEK